MNFKKFSLIMYTSPATVAFLQALNKDDKSLPGSDIFSDKLLIADDYIDHPRTLASL